MSRGLGDVYKRQERAFVRFLDGGCSSPVAAHAVLKGEELFLLGLYYDEKTGNYEKGDKTGSAKDAEELGISLAKELRSRCEKRQEGRA